MLKSKDNKELLETARKRFKIALDAHSKFKATQQEDLRFVSGEQWDSQRYQERVSSGRPCFTINRIPSFVRMVVNEQRQSRPSIEVNPVSSDADIKTAEIMSGLIRHIEYDSNAEVAYDNAGYYAATTGEGFFKLTTEYESEDLFETTDSTTQQGDLDAFKTKLCIKQIANPANVYLDPNSIEINGSDAEWCFIIDDIPKDEFDAKYPDSETTTKITELGWGMLALPDNWQTRDTIRIADYYYKEYATKTLYYCQTIQDDGNGNAVPFEFVTETKPDPMVDLLTTVINKRKVRTPIIKVVQMNGNEVLEETTFPGRFIPVVPVYGDRIFLDDEVVKSGMVHELKHSQQRANYFKSMQAEIVDMAPRAPFIVAEGQVGNRTHSWNNLNVLPQAYLEYTPVDLNGNQIPPPERATWEAPIQAISATAASAEDDMKSITGIFDPSLGQQGNEISGKAILSRQAQSNTANFHYLDNLNQSIKHLGRMICNAIPEVYDTARMVRIIKPSGESEMMVINTINENGKRHDLTIGKYDVVVKTGPSFQTRRQEAANAGLEFLKMDPAATAITADLIVKNFDWPGADMIAARLKTQVPPQVLEATGEDQGNKNAEQILPQVKQQLQQTQQQMQQLIQYGQQVENALKQTQEELKIEKERSKVELLKAASKEDIDNKKLELDKIQTQLDYKIKQKELLLATAELELKKKELAIQGIELGHEMMNDMFHASNTHGDNMLKVHMPAVQVDTHAQGLSNTNINGQ